MECWSEIDLSSSGKVSCADIRLRQIEFRKGWIQRKAWNMDETIHIWSVAGLVSLWLRNSGVKTFVDHWDLRSVVALYKVPTLRKAPTWFWQEIGLKCGLFIREKDSQVAGMDPRLLVNKAAVSVKRSVAHVKSPKDPTQNCTTKRLHGIFITPKSGVEGAQGI